MSKIYYGRNGKKYMLEDKAFASGGEGEVFNIIGDNGNVAKVYKSIKFTVTKYDSDPRTSMKEKIETMLDQPVDPFLNGDLIVAWPVDTLCDGNGMFCGYIMPRVNANKSIITGESESKREKFFSNYNFRHSVVMSYNMATIVERIQASGAIVGDFNPQNFMLNTDGTIVRVDADSFDIRNTRTGKVYKCTVGVPEMLPPELQGRNLASPSSHFTDKTDDFALAVHIFVLLMNNRHPFTVRMPQASRSSQAGTKLENNIVQGKCPYTTSSKWRNNTPPGALDIMMLPDYVRRLFDRAFSFDEQNAASIQIINNRPTAREWREAMARMINEIDSKKVYDTCVTYKSHIYRHDYGTCPYCAKTKPIPKKFPSPILVNGNTNNSTNNQYTQQAHLTYSTTTSIARRTVYPLWIFSILFGIITGVSLSPMFHNWIYGLFNFDLYITAIQVIMSALGIAAGIVVSYFLGDYYQNVSNGLLALLISLLAPVATFVGGIALLLAAALVIIVVNILIALVKILLIILIIGVIIGALLGG